MRLEERGMTGLLAPEPRSLGVLGRLQWPQRRLSFTAVSTPLAEEIVRL
jgi:hypothetical protein